MAISSSGSKVVVTKRVKWRDLGELAQDVGWLGAVRGMRYVPEGSVRYDR
jgi:hypothetical protein